MDPLTLALGGSALFGAGAQLFSGRRAEKAQERAAARSAEQIEQATGEAKSALGQLFPAATKRSGQGYQQALNVFRRAVPEQMQAFQQGNVGAQQALLAGLPLAQSAILGGQIDYSALQPVTIDQPDMSFAAQNLPHAALSGLGSINLNNLLNPQAAYDPKNDPNVGVTNLYRVHGLGPNAPMGEQFNVLRKYSPNARSLADLARF